MKSSNTVPYEPIVRLEKKFVPSLYICGLNTPSCIQFLINLEVFTVGSGKDNNGIVAAEAMGLSPAHCVIEYAEEGYTITDKNSLNGTFVNNRRLLPETKYPIRNGDQLRLGMALFSVDEIVQEEQ